MTIKKEINKLRGNLMRMLTRGIGASQADQGIGLKDRAKITRILICRPNHRLGNLLLITPLLQEISEMLPGAKIDLFVKGNLAPSIFKNYDHINHIIQLPKKPFKNFFKYLQGWIMIRRNNYDIVINVINNSSSGRLSAQFANAKYKFFGDAGEDIPHQYQDYAHIAKFPVYSFRHYLSKPQPVENGKQVAALNLKLSPSETAEGKKILKNLVKNEKRTICLFTNATGAKLYPEAWWEDFYERLKTEFTEYNIIEVLPVENTSQIAFKAPTYFNRDIRVIGSFIANTDVFIGADSGMMHLASSVQTPTVGLFKIANLDSYAPYNADSVAINTNTSNMDNWIEILKGILHK
jgi:ADP-heptose:LPS heptosyltransferase